MDAHLWQQLLFGGALSLLAGLSTGIGAAVALFIRKPDTRLLTLALGASAGVMVYISFMELMPTASDMLGSPRHWLPTLLFFGGMGLAALIDFLIPEDENPHELPAEGELEHAHGTGQFTPLAGVRRSAILFCLAIGIHNFPEGIATMASAFDSTGIAASVALAVAIHNVPEGIAVALPLLYGTGDRRMAFLWATASGLAEPVGALIGMAILLPFLSPALLSALFGLVSGIMVYIAFDELLPMAERWGQHHFAISGVILGMAIMALVL